MPQEHPAVVAMSPDEAEHVRRSKNITVVEGDNIPKPVRTFEEASFPEYVLEDAFRPFWSKLPFDSRPLSLSQPLLGRHRLEPDEFEPDSSQTWHCSIILATHLGLPPGVRAAMLSFVHSGLSCHLRSLSLSWPLFGEIVLNLMTSSPIRPKLGLVSNRLGRIRPTLALESSANLGPMI